MTEKDFVLHITKQLSDSGIKSFPDSFINSAESEILDLPGKIFIPGNRIFDKFEIISIDGESSMQFDNFTECKYAVYASRNSKRPVYIPADKNILENVTTSYEKYVDSILIFIQNEFRKNFPKSVNLTKIINQIINKLNLARY